MRLWKVIVLVDVAVALTVAAAYLHWGRQVERLRVDLAAAHDAAAAGAAPRSWTVDGIVRAVLPDTRVVVLTHETIPGVMSAMTMGFDVEDLALLAGVTPGDRVQFTVTREGGRLRLVGMERREPS